MAVKTENHLSDNARSLWLKALSAVEIRNFGYAISLLHNVLKESPEFLDARRLIRKAEIANTKGKKSFFSGLSVKSGGAGLVKKDPIAAMEAAEKSLESDPYSVQANHLLRDAAKAAGFLEIATFALETICEGHPTDTKLMHELGAHYNEIGESDKAVKIYTRISELNPTDLIANKMGKDASARASMKSGGWETAKDYRDLIKNKDEAVSLEQKSRVVKSEEAIDQQINELYARAEQEPQNVDVARRIAALFEEKNDAESLGSAIWWYQKASELMNNVDNNLLRKISDLNLKNLEYHIKAREDFLASVTEDHELYAQYQQELDDLKRQKAAMSVDEARKRVERNPTDLQFRYELGEQLMTAGEYTDAIPELQKARNNPSVRLKAMNLLGKCYIEKGMLDLAVKQFTDASSEILSMDGLKKEIIYSLGLVYEQMGNREKSLDCMKEIYEVDYGYRDVAQRVEQSYAQ